MATNEAGRRRAAAARKAEQQESARGVTAMKLLEIQRQYVVSAEMALRARRQEQTELMVSGRQAGLTWDDLASSSGITRQAVQQRVGAALASPE